MGSSEAKLVSHSKNAEARVDLKERAQIKTETLLAHA